jgi:hypothetical protein
MMGNELSSAIRGGITTLGRLKVLPVLV